MSEIDNIAISYEPSVDNISLDPINEITSILLQVGDGVQSVLSVNSLKGSVVLTEYTELSSPNIVNGYYLYSISHTLNTDSPLIGIYSTGGDIVLTDINIVDSNNVIIKSAIDISGYRVVIQR